MAEVRRHQADRSAKKGKGKARGKLPVKVRRRKPLGVRATAATTCKHSLADVVSDLRAVADQLEQESATEDQAAARGRGFGAATATGRPISPRPATRA